MLKRFISVTVTAIVLAIVQAPRVLTEQAGSTPKSATQTRAPSPAAADIASMPLFAVMITQVKPDMLLEWQEFQKKETIPTLQKGGVKQRSAFQTVIGPAFEYAFLTPMANLAERDGDSPQVKALGAEGARAMGDRARRLIASTRSFVVRQRTDLSWAPSMAGNPVAVISDYSIAAGKTQEFENYIKTELMPAHKQVKSPGFSVFQTLFGGAPTFVVATMAPNMAALDQGPAIARAFGQAGAARAQQKLTGVVTHVERTVVRVVPDLSFGAAPPTNSSR
jgi:hypothetical protein